MLDDVKQLLGFSDGAKDKLINQIMGTTESRLLLKLGGLETVPFELEYIVDEVSVIRYNRISSEGAESHSVDGVSTTYLEDDFAPFESDISEWKRQNGKRRMRFL